ncbi:MAG: GTPase, partial [Verrucomicrobiota bacterium]
MVAAEVTRLKFSDTPGEDQSLVTSAATFYGRNLFLSQTRGVLHHGRVPGLIAIVGRPNVGKSALFNRIVGRRIAIVHDQPGVTRDRVSAEGEWHGRPFTLVDTGGIGLLRREKSEDVITRAALSQVGLAIEAANVIILVVNVREGVVALDREAAARLRQSGKPVLVA